MSTPTPCAVDTHEAARILGVCVDTLKYWRVQGKGPRYVKYGYCVRYRVKDLEAFMEAHLVDPGAKPE